MAVRAEGSEGVEGGLDGLLFGEMVEDIFVGMGENMKIHGISMDFYGFLLGFNGKKRDIFHGIVNGIIIRLLMGLLMGL